MNLEKLVVEREGLVDETAGGGMDSPREGGREELVGRGGGGGGRGARS